VVQSLLADCQRGLNGETVLFVNRVCGEHTIDVVHSRDHSCEVGDLSRFVVFFFACTTREEECCVFKYLLFRHYLIRNRTVCAVNTPSIHHTIPLQPSIHSRGVHTDGVSYPYRHRSDLARSGIAERKKAYQT
jgi:hypothetical protein